MKKRIDASDTRWLTAAPIPLSRRIVIVPYGSDADVPKGVGIICLHDVAKLSRASL